MTTQSPYVRLDQMTLAELRVVWQSLDTEAEFVRTLIEEGRIIWNDDAPILEGLLEGVEYFCTSQDA